MVAQQPAYFEPVQEEATVEGGLDKDQIAAFINRTWVNHLLARTRSSR